MERAPSAQSNESNTSPCASGHAPASLATLPIELLDLITLNMVVHVLDPGSNCTTCTGSQNLLRLARTCRILRAAALRRLLERFTFTDSVVSEMGTRSSCLWIAKQFCSSCRLDRDNKPLEPLCPIYVVPDGDAGATLSGARRTHPMSALSVPASWITTLQVGFSSDTDESRILLCRSDDIGRILPNLAQLFCRTVSEAGRLHVQVILKAVAGRVAVLVMEDPHGTTWLPTSTPFPHLHTLVWNLPTLTLPLVPALRHLRLLTDVAIFYQPASPLDLVSSLPHLETLTALGTVKHRHVLVPRWKTNFLSGSEDSGHDDLDLHNGRAQRHVAEILDQRTRLWRVRTRATALREWLAPVLPHLTHLHILPEPEAALLVDFGAKLINLTTLTLERDEYFERWHPLEAADLIPLAQLQHLAHLECDVVESWEWMENDKNEREMRSQVEAQRPDLHGSGVVDLIHLRLRALDSIFPALVTGKCSALFFVLLAPMTLLSLRTAHVKVTMATWSACQFQILLPTMPALRVLQFDRGWEDAHDARLNLWTVPSATTWATTMPILETLVCLSRIMHIPGLAHPNLRNLLVSVPAWKRLTKHAVDLPRLTNVTFTGGDLDSPCLTSLHALLPDGGMPNVERLNLSCQEALTVTAAEHLTRLHVRDVCRRSSVDEELTVMSSDWKDAIRVEYTHENARAWQLLCDSIVIPGGDEDDPDSLAGHVPQKVEVDIAPGVKEMDLKRLEMLVKWAAKLKSFEKQVIELRTVGGTEWVEKLCKDARWIQSTYNVALVVGLASSQNV
ncbi:hypothetical protein AMAG_08442 [Allomyces macrogynus ATCC 38327]|uniref:Uncharacterized protein n=1 Tax=Allomyces macrogynus (strain ATCC 38327) TaxID=578462 RepID=A0A0L0SLB1_ALLM3|nr:hypothetical protein AMAG_08442 [Allomyces macrogynus ATCC 38327]|eukprot:KNE63302.1 hypothetical protein AMAG_08442 [Allomyces macrogynus ATCC 38327]